MRQSTIKGQPVSGLRGRSVTDHPQSSLCRKPTHSNADRPQTGNRLARVRRTLLLAPLEGADSSQISCESRGLEVFDRPSGRFSIGQVARFLIGHVSWPVIHRPELEPAHGAVERINRDGDEVQPLAAEAIFDGEDIPGKRLSADDTAHLERELLQWRERT